MTKENMTYNYEITPRPVELDGGWQLRLLENDVEVGGGMFPVQMDPYQGVTWWSAMTENERGQWLKKADSARPADAYQAFLLADAYTAAMAEANDWIDTRER